MLVETVAAAILLAGANYADLRTSQQALRMPGAVEVNSWAMGRHGERLVPVKIAVCAVETAGFYAIRRKHRRTAWVYVGAVVAVNVGIAYHNRSVARGVR